MIIVLETSYRHGELCSFLEKLRWTPKDLSKKTGVSLRIIKAIISISHRPTQKENNLIFECFANEGCCVDLLNTWPEDFLLPTGSKKTISHEEADVEFLTKGFPEKRLIKIGQQKETEDCDRIDAGFFLDAIKEILSADEIIIFRSAIEGLTNQETATRYSFPLPTVQNRLIAIRRKIFRLANKLEVSEENLRKLVSVFTDHSYAIPKAEGRSLQIWKENHLPKSKATVAEFDNQIRIRFDSKPNELIEAQLRKNGWRLNEWNKCWYHVPTEEALGFAYNLQNAEILTPAPSPEQTDRQASQEKLF